MIDANMRQIQGHKKSNVPGEVCALVPVALGYGREVVRGMARRLSAAGATLRVIDSWRPNFTPMPEADAFVSLSGTVETLKLVRKAGATVVNVSARDDELQQAFPSVLPDNVTAGRLAGEHLLMQGYRRFVTVYRTPFAYSEQRIDGFAKVCGEGGDEIRHVQASTLNQPVRHPRIRDWFRQNNEPVGVLITEDELARNFLALCQSEHIAIPDQVGVVSVNNDDMICDTLNPPLSSVDLNAQRIGYEAASLALRLHAGADPPSKPIIIPPAGVVMRHSTRAIAISDPLVQRAVARMMQQLGTPRTIESLADELEVSKRKLERRFVDAIGVTPADHWRALRLRHAADLLAQTDQSLKKVSDEAGFVSFQHFCNVFRKQFEMTPSEYRQVRRLR